MSVVLSAGERHCLFESEVDSEIEVLCFSSRRRKIERQRGQAKGR